jgi:hypothetical protein
MLRVDAQHDLAVLGVAQPFPTSVAVSRRYGRCEPRRARHCRTYSLHTAGVASKRGALEWARDNLDPRWRPLLAQVMADRALGWDAAQAPRAGSMAATYEFAAYAQTVHPVDRADPHPGELPQSST